MVQCEFCGEEHEVRTVCTCIRLLCPNCERLVTPGQDERELCCQYCGRKAAHVRCFRCNEVLFLRALGVCRCLKTWEEGPLYVLVYPPTTEKQPIIRLTDVSCEEELSFQQLVERCRILSTTPFVQDANLPGHIHVASITDERGNYLGVDIIYSQWISLEENIQRWSAVLKALKLHN